MYQHVSGVKEETIIQKNPHFHGVNTHTLHRQQIGKQPGTTTLEASTLTAAQPCYINSQCLRDVNRYEVITFNLMLGNQSTLYT